MLDFCQNPGTCTQKLFRDLYLSQIEHYNAQFWKKSRLCNVHLEE